jgi:hypothetical protein
MKIIDIAICTENIDPKGLGRIRCIRYNEYNVGEKDFRKFTVWGDDDPYMASPFLPFNINYIPEVGQAVKILQYNNEKDDINVEYIAGPFTNVHDSRNQTFNQQLRYTTYGTSNKENVDIFDANGNYVDNKSKNAFAKPEDFSVSGKYGSDIIFSENGVQIRGGKFIAKDAASDSNRKKLLNYPIVSKKASTLYLRKFAKKMTLEETNVETIETSASNLKYIVEYELDSLSNPTKINFFVYKVLKNYGEITRTNYFNSTTPLPPEKKLINVENDNTSPTYSIICSSLIGKNLAQEIRNVIYKLHESSLKKLNSLYSDDDLHPFYFRPTLPFSTTVTDNETEKNLKVSILTNVSVYSNVQSGLIWSILNVKPPSKTVITKQQTLKKHDSSLEQTFSALTSDNIFLLSTDTNNTDKSIDFNNLDLYSLNQEDYVKKITPNTYAVVRGENLIKLLRAIIKVLITHRHNPTEQFVQNGYDDFEALKKLVLTMENDVLNNSIRLN